MALILLPAKLRRLLRAHEGSTAIELAFAFPVVLMTVVGLMELAMILFVSALMEGGLRDASRFGITGNVPQGLTREQAIVNIVNDRTLGLLDLTPSDVRMRVYKAFDQVGKPEPITNDVNGNGSYDPGDSYTDVNGNGQWDADMAASGAGDSGDVVVYDITIDWPLLTPIMAPFIGHDGLITLGASIAVRNEPWAVAP
jgi:hypothetical protein